MNFDFVTAPPSLFRWFPLPPKGSVMPQQAWSAKRERHYVHIKESLLERGKPEPLAEKIAARVPC